jgi:hypothetical protein
MSIPCRESFTEKENKMYTYADYQNMTTLVSEWEEEVRQCELSGQEVAKEREQGCLDRERDKLHEIYQYLKENNLFPGQ